MGDIDPLLELLQEDSSRTPAQLAALLGVDEADVREKVAAWEADGTILGYQALVDRNRVRHGVTAFIEVRITPERGGGFGRLARRLARFDEVRSCHLISGGYDLAVVVVADDLHAVARFVTDKLSTMEGVLSTSTHFILTTYKESGKLMEGEEEDGRLPVSP
jgi:DNA-binding Lrp family transcriptional regulator